MKLSRTEAQAAGAVIEPVGDWRRKLCHCSICGETSVCAPNNDFYVREGENQLRCGECVRVMDDGRVLPEWPGGRGAA